MSKGILVIDYGMGNLQSVLNAIRFFGYHPQISGDPGSIIKADALILPGVGSFRKAMETISSNGISSAIQEAVLIKKKKILGICLGMQLFAATGSEDGKTFGLNFVSAAVERFNVPAGQCLKVPHIGFNEVYWQNQGDLFKRIESPRDFYFVHSFRMSKIDDKCTMIAHCNHGEDFVAAFQKDNVFGTQFHPEKSQTNGLQLLDNFLKA